MRELSDIYQSLVFLVFGQNNGHYSTDDSLNGEIKSFIHKKKKKTSWDVTVYQDSRIWQAERPPQELSLNLVTHQQACHDGDDIRDSVHHHRGLNADGDVPVHGAVHQSSQKEVDVAHQH